MKIACDVGQTYLTNDRGISVPSLRATCTVCGHTVRVYGTGDASVKRCMATMREGCPKDEENYYVRKPMPLPAT